MKLKFVIPLALIMATAPSHAQQPPSPAEFDRLVNNTQEGMSECVAYFQLVGRCVGQTPNGASTAAGYSRAADLLLEKTYILGKKVGLTDDAMQSRLGLAAKSMMTLIKGDCVNIASLLARHMDRCQEIANDPLRPIMKAIPQK